MGVRDGQGLLDVAIVGGGPAGLAAGLVLGRCRRSVALIDAGAPRNIRARKMNGYLTRDGVSPAEFLKKGREEVAAYGVQILSDRVVEARRVGEGCFLLQLDSGEEILARKLLLATGVRDVIPSIQGIDEFYGVSVHHCPYCDGWEHRDKRIVSVGKGDGAIGLALSLRTWTRRVTACCDGVEPSEGKRGVAERNDIAVRLEVVTRVEGQSGALRSVHFETGEPVLADALFFHTGQYQRSDLPGSLGCAFDKNGHVVTSDRQCTGVPGLYLAGDADKDVQFVLVAAAEGAIAATAINRELQNAERGTE